MTIQERGNEPTAIIAAMDEVVQRLDLVKSTTPTRPSPAFDIEAYRERRAAMTNADRDAEDLQREKSRIAADAEKAAAKDAVDRALTAKNAWFRAIEKIGKRYFEARLDNFVVSDLRQNIAIDRLRNLTERLPAHCDAGHGIAFIGPMGTGKDHLAVAMLFEAAKRYSMTVGWCDGQELFAEFRDRIGEEAREMDKIRELVRPDVLLISDPIPQSGAITDFQQSILYRVIDRRYREMKPTWVTINVANREEAEKRLGAQVVDRLSEGAVNILCNWDSYRKTVGKP